MFIADDILLFPFKGLLTIFQEIYKAALEDVAGEADRLRAELSALYQKLEQGLMADSDFDDAESRILDRLDEIESHSETIEMGDVDLDDDELSDDLDDYEDTDDEDEDGDDDDEDEDDEGPGESYEYVYDDPTNPWITGGPGSQPETD